MGCLNTKAVHSNDSNLGTSSLVWLDAKGNTTEENKTVQQTLRQIINRLKIFDNRKSCKRYILSISSQDRHVLIVSGGYGRQLVPQIHNLSQPSSIYVYCMDKKANEQWTKNFSKVWHNSLMFFGVLFLSSCLGQTCDC
jgi:hypothetical protein